jgi:hypothetical protein
MATDKNSYTAEEWQTLQFAPMWTLSAVGKVDDEIDEKEFKAFVQELAEAPLYKTPLVREVLSSIANDFSSVSTAYGADERKIDPGLDDVANLLDEKSDPEEANGFKSAVIGIGQKVARASGGMFGDKMSDDEKGALAFVAMHLRWDPPE